MAGKIVLNGITYNAGSSPGGGDNIHLGTKAYWNAQASLIGESGHLYVYTDYAKDENNNDVPGIKIGDGLGYLIDAPFVDGNREELLSHIADTVAHVTQNDRDAWDEKVRCYISPNNSERIVFTTAPSSPT